IAHGICRGILYLNSVGIFHHDLRCRNVMITSFMEPKLANFHFARMMTDPSINISNILEVINWMAPEKMREYAPNSVKIPYTQKCEIFSFGMLLWEFAYGRTPYENKDMDSIIKHVMNGQREECSYIHDPKNDQAIKEYIKIVRRAWEHIEEERITIGELYLELTGLLKKGIPNRFTPTESSSCPETSTMAIKGQMTELKLDDDIFSEKILPLEEGIRLHRTGIWENKKLAFGCFKENSKLGNATAMYWYARYFLDGHYTNENRSEERKSLDKAKALKIFKMAADEDNADAQLLYAFTLPNTKRNRENFLSYLKRAADNGNDIAMYHLADIYLNGKRNIPCNKQLGLRYLKLSALKKNELSLRLAKAMNVNIYDSNDANDS
ncbi:22200_t:CDS:2, partial [Cetraspora pellucida]